MKSLLLTGFFSMGVAHTGAFLTVWELPYVEDHVTFKDVGRKLNKVFEWDKTSDTLRDARSTAAEENYALFTPTTGRVPIVEKKGYALRGARNKSSKRR